MKKIFVLVLIVAMTLVFGVCAFAETPTDILTAEESNSTANYTPEEENATESEISSDSDISLTDDIVPLSAKIVAFIEEHFEGTSFISLAITVVVYIFFEVKNNKKLKLSIGSLNNNAIEITNVAVKNVNDAFAKAQDLVNTVAEYKKDFESFLYQLQKNAEEKKSLEDTLATVENFMKVITVALKENSAEVYDLLMASNIPNAVKNDMCKRHKQADEAIEGLTEGV